MKKFRLVLALPVFAAIFFSGCNNNQFVPFGDSSDSIGGNDISSSSVGIVGGISSSSSVISSLPSSSSISSSSLRVSSSSSSVRISSSSSVASTPAPSYPTLSQGQSGVQSGYATRYWDACKAACSWAHEPQALGTRCKNCGRDGTTEIAAKDDNKSSCDGGNAYTCYDQIPYKVNDNLSYAFAATPGGDCGKCYQLQFTGGGKYANDANHKAIEGKTLIVISSNKGYDVSGGQFDLLIPGGGVGAFDAFSNQISVSKDQLGVQYGGLLSACENENNYDASKYKSCLTNKCNLFTNATLKEGCLWLANWMQAANNPNVLYKQVECPQYLVDKYKAKML